MNTIFNIMEKLEEVTRQIGIMEAGFEFEVRNMKTNDNFRFQTNDKMYGNVLEYLYNKQNQLIEDLKEALIELTKI